MSKEFIGMGTCGLATGAGQVKSAAEKWASAHGTTVDITATGCIGYCKAEPIMDVVTDSGHRVSYSNVTPDVAGFILEYRHRGRGYGHIQYQESRQGLQPSARVRLYSFQ